MTRREILETSDENPAHKQSMQRLSDELTQWFVDLQKSVRLGSEDPILSLLIGKEMSEIVRRTGWNSLVINPGSTSTKVSVYNGLTLVASEEMRQQPGEQDGVQQRVQKILAWFERQKLRLNEITGIAARGGFLAPVPGGTYRITHKMIDDLRDAPYQHASNLSVPMALALGEMVGPDVLLTVTDPVTVDELDPVYRLTGSKRIRNDGMAVHYLNHRASAALIAQRLGQSVGQLHMITCHMGGGMSAARHWQGRMVQVAQGFGAMPSANRSGSLPLHQVIRLLERQELGLEDLHRDVMSKGGLLSLAGTDDFEEFFKFRVRATDEQQKKIDLITQFFANRVAGCIQELSACPEKVQAVALTGGLARDEHFCRLVADRIQLDALVIRLPGAVEQQALVAGLLRAGADPTSRRNYHECRDAYEAERKEVERILDLTLLGRTPQREQMQIPTRMEDLILTAGSSSEPATVAVVGADNEEALLAVKAAIETRPRPLARFLLVGPYGRVSQLCWELDVPIDEENTFIIDADDAIAKGLELLNAGLADTLMKGSVMTAALLKGILGFLKGKGLSGRKLRLSHIGLFEIPGRSKLVCVTDAAINTYPDVEARVDILENALEAMRLLGFLQPKVAVISAVEKPSQAVVSSMEGQAIAEKFKDRPDLIIEGPLSVDLALSPQSAKEKGYKGKIQGDADLLLVPDIDTGNAIYKAFTVTSGAAIAGAVIGGQVPVVLTSRGDSSRSKLASIGLVLTLTQRGKAGRSS